jgi:RimJ/RimL family protein N-acetyltransferase
MIPSASKPPISEHEAHGVILRPLDASHLDLTLAWRNRDGVRQRFLHDELISPDDHRAWFQRYLGKSDDIVLLAYLPAQPEPFGQVAIYGIDHVAGHAEVGRFVVAPEHQGRGLMRRAMLALLDLAHKVLGLRVLSLEVREDNLRAVAIYETIGFVRDGCAAGVLRMRLPLAA